MELKNPISKSIDQRTPKTFISKEKKTQGAKQLSDHRHLSVTDGLVKYNARERFRKFQ